MSNPLEGQDFIVIMKTTEDLTGSTVTIRTRNPYGKVTIDLVPTAVDIDSGVISYRIDASIAMPGKWLVGGKIINALGYISYINPPVVVVFDKEWKNSI